MTAQLDQQEYERRWEEGLDKALEITSANKQQAMQIGKELGDQQEQLDDLDHGFDVIEERQERVNKKLDIILAASSSCTAWILTAVFLLAMILVLVCWPKKK